MAKLSVLPSQAIIDGFVGVVDFYLYRGIPVARKWPRYPARTPSAEEQQARDDLAHFSTLANEITPRLQRYYEQLATSTPLTWRDWFIKAAMHGISY